MMKTLMFAFFLFLTLNGASGYRYALPGDASWPTFGEFFNLKISIAGNVMFKNEHNYKPHTWNMRTNLPKPAVIVQPKNPNDVITALKFAKQHNIRLSVQSTGHHQDTRNIFDNSIHLDMSSMNSKSIDLAKRTLTLGPGNNFTQIHTFVAMQSNRTLVAAGGADPGVGIYGWTTGGGHGYMTRLYGLGVDFEH
jgi:FAD/FMN-containing dehydrogenase